MIECFNIKNNLDKEKIDLISNSWKNKKIKIIHLKSQIKSNNVRDFYEVVGQKIGKLCHFAEDVNLGDRSSQRTNKIWMEVRYDSKINDAYRHSSNPQPLHTDGSYIPKYPNATLMCCVSNSTNGGETTFVNPEELTDILKEEEPHLLKFLLETKIAHERSGDKKNKKILEKNNEKYEVNWNYYCISKKNSKNNLLLAEKFFNFLNNSEKVKKITKTVKLETGDAVFWKDSEVLHGRNGFSPKKDSDRFLWKCAIDIGK
jgi:alpha-ketoglutarate-dependent taurine dioxygenase